MKRNQHLITLSWEHHHGLVTVFRIKRGVSNRTAPELIADFIQFMWSNELKPHFQLEEDYLVPHLVKLGSAATLLKRMTDEHRELEEIATGIKSNPDKIATFINSFAQGLEKHIRFEERELFPFIEQNVDEKTLENIGGQLKSLHKASCAAWQPEFWK